MLCKQRGYFGLRCGFNNGRNEMGGQSKPKRVRHIKIRGRNGSLAGFSRRGSGRDCKSWCDSGARFLEFWQWAVV